MTQTDDHDDHAVLGEEKPPAAGTTWLTISLCVLNLLAVLAFAYLLLMDLSARQRWGYQIYRHDLAIQGKPLKEEEKVSGSHLLGTGRLPLSSEAIAEAYKTRTGKTPPDKFRPSELELQRIRPEDLNEEILKDVFSKFDPKPVATLDQEIANVKGDLLERIDKATEGAPKLAKDANGKRQLLYFYLLPLTHLTDQVDQVAVLDKAIELADAAKLDELVADAAKRKMLVDLLSRLEEFRPHDPAAKDDVLLRAAALTPAKGQAAGLTKERYQVKTEDLADRLGKRVEETLEGQQTDVEKRQRVAFLLFLLSRTRGTDNEPLYPPARAEVVLGVRPFTRAADTYAMVLDQLQRRLMPAIARDRGQYVYPLDYRVHDPAKFAEKLTMLLAELGTFPKKGDKADPQAVKRREAFQAAARDLFTKEKGNLKTGANEKETAGEKALKLVQGLLKEQGVVINEDKEDQKVKVKQAMFDLAVVRMVDGYEPGFVGRHHELVNVVRELSERITLMNNRLKEMTEQATKLEKEYQSRKQHEALVAKKVFDARAATQKMAADLDRLQFDRFRAQIELADADRRNQIMERRIRTLEQNYLKGKGRRPQR
jgi:hypothetical protein